jgi:signal transduction histidine kinase
MRWRAGEGFGEQFLSAAGLPITIKDRVIGVIQVYGQTAGQFDSQDLELLSAIGRQIGAAVENARLFEETAQRAGQQEALNVVASTMSQSLDLDELFKIALDKLVEVTGRERATIRLKDAETGRVELFAHRGFTEEEVEDLRRKTPHRTSEQVFASGEAMVINESESDSYSESLLRHSRSVAWIPMKSRSDVIGVLGISATRPMAFSPRELDFLQAIANVVGVALDNVRAYQQTRRNLERIRALHEIDKAILSSLDVKTVLDVLLEQIEVFLPYPAVTMIRLFNRKTGVLEPAACRGVDETEWKKSGNITATSNPMFFKQRAPFVISDLRQEPGPLDPEFLAKNHLVSLLVVPLFAKGETLGALSFYTRERHHFSGQETEFLSTLAGQAAIAIYNSQLYGELREQALELERSNKVKSEFLGIMSHELTTPITAIMGYATLIDEEVTGKANPEQKRAAQVIRQKGDDLLLMIRGILEATKLESGGAVVEKKNVDVAGLLNELKGSFTVPPEKSVSLYWEYGADLPSIRTDGAKLKQILNNLIQNAIKFTSEGSVSVSARYEPEAQVMRLRVKDTGAGIPPEMLPTIFEKFRQVDSSDTRCYEGIGLGLFIAKKFAELLGGEILVESETGKGSSFCVTLPWRPDEAASRSTDSELPSYRQSMRLL